MIEWAGYLKTAIWKSSPKPEIVLFGKQDWLFYNAKGDLIYGSYSHKNLLSNKDLEAYYLAHLEKNKICSNNDVDYYCQLTWPNKHTVYEENLSWQMQLQKVGDVSKREQILNLFKSKNGGQYFDVTDYLKIKKQERQLYLKYDTHWNPYGAFYAYQKVMDTLKDLNLPPYKVDSFEIRTEYGYSGDLVNLMGRKEMAKPDLVPLFEFKNKLDTTINRYVHEDVFVEDYVNNGLNSEKVLLIFGDSYGHGVQWLFLLHFKRVIFVKVPFREDFIQHFKPNIVFEAHVERYL